MKVRRSSIQLLLQYFVHQTFYPACHYLSYTSRFNASSKQKEATWSKSYDIKRSHVTAFSSLNKLIHLLMRTSFSNHLQAVSHIFKHIIL